MTGRARQITPITREAFNDLGANVVPLPPVDWFVRGPRGGLYEAIGERTREIGQKNMLEADWLAGRDVVYVIDSSQGVKYLRPGSKRYAEAVTNVT